SAYATCACSARHASWSAWADSIWMSWAMKMQERGFREARMGNRNLRLEMGIRDSKFETAFPSPLAYPLGQNEKVARRPDEGCSCLLAALLTRATFVAARRSLGRMALTQAQ